MIDETLPVPVGMRRVGDALMNITTYHGSPCKSCGRTERYLKNRGCVWCINKRNFLNAKTVRELTFEKHMAAIRSNRQAQELFGDDFTEFFEQQIAAFRKLHGTVPETNRFYVSASECPKEHPKIRSADTGKCMSCEIDAGRDFNTRGSASRRKSFTVEQATKALWVHLVGREQAAKMQHLWLPSHLRPGAECKHGHPGVKYKVGGACWFCLNGRAGRKPRLRGVRGGRRRKSRIDAPLALLIAALVA